MRVRNIISKFKSLDDFIESSKIDLQKLEGINLKISETLISEKKNIRQYEVDFDELQNKNVKEDIRTVNIFDEEYPENLKRIYDAPVFIYIKGKLDKKDVYSISVVGTRNPTDYGRKVCEKLTSELSELGIPIISGLAKGIDSVAHITALKKGNLTYAVLGCGLNIIYPSENKKLYSKIIENGALISEFEFGTGPDKTNFPKRNRLISGISVGTVIIETGIKGGSLITAGFALDQNKEVFAVPGNIYAKFSTGTNELIKKGQAKLIVNIDDIISELNYKFKAFISKDKRSDVLNENIPMNVFEKKIYDVLNEEPVHIDSINYITNLSISDCLVNLLSLEFKGLVKQLPGKFFVKV